VSVQGVDQKPGLSSHLYRNTSARTTSKANMATARIKIRFRSAMTYWYSSAKLVGSGGGTVTPTLLATTRGRARRVGMGRLCLVRRVFLALALAITSFSSFRPGTIPLALFCDGQRHCTGYSTVHLSCTLYLSVQDRCGQALSPPALYRTVQHVAQGRRVQGL